MSASTEIQVTSRPAARRRIQLSWKQKVFLITLANLACFFSLWELVTTYGNVPNAFLPKFSLILGEFPLMMKEGILLPNLTFSVVNYLIGLAIGIAIGLPLAFAIGGIKIVDRILSPYLWALFSTPRIVLVPLVFLWFGITNQARLVIVAISVLPSFVVVVMEGIKTTNSSYLRVARTFGAKRWKLFKNVLIPASIPWIAIGLRQGMLRGLIGLYVGELFITTNGLGSILSLARIRFDSARMFAVLFLFVGFAVTTLALTRILETRMTKWKASVEV